MKTFALFVLCILFLSGTVDARMISGEVIGDGKGTMEQVSELSPIHMAELEAKYDPTGQKPKSYRRTIEATHYYAAKPSEGAKEITIVIKNRFGKTWKETILLKK